MSQKQQRKKRREMAKRPTEVQFARGFKRVGKILVPLAALGVFAYLGVQQLHKPETLQRVSEQAPTRKSRYEQLAEADSLHFLPNMEGERQQFYTRSETGALFPDHSKVLFYTPNRRYCENCHDLQTLASDQIRTLKRMEREVDSIYGSHADLRTATFGFYPGSLERFGVTSHAGGFTRASSDQFVISLPHYVNRELRDWTTAHELVHYHTTMPDHYMMEKWAYVFPYLKEPRRVSKPVDEHSGAVFLNPAVLRLFERAAGLAKKTPPNIRDADFGGGSRDIEMFRYYQRTLTPKDIERMGQIYRRAFQEYKRNNIFWDAASAYFLHDHLLEDVLIAKELHDKKDSAFVTALSSPRLSEARQFLAAVPKKFSHVALSEKINYLAWHGPRTTEDPRRVFHGTFQPSNAEEADAHYYAALYGLFFDEKGRWQYNVVPAPQLEKSAEFKRTQLAGAIAEIDGQLQNLRATIQDPAALKTLSEGLENRRRLFASRMAEFSSAIQSRRFVRE